MSKSRDSNWSSSFMEGETPIKSTLGKTFRKQIKTLVKPKEVVKVVNKHKK